MTALSNNNSANTPSSGKNNRTKSIVIIAVAVVAIAVIAAVCGLQLKKSSSTDSGSGKKDITLSVENKGVKENGSAAVKENSSAAVKENSMDKAEDKNSTPEAAAQKAMDALLAGDAAALERMTADVVRENAANGNGFSWFMEGDQDDSQSVSDCYQVIFDEYEAYNARFTDYDLGETTTVSDTTTCKHLSKLGVDEDTAESYCGKVARVEMHFTVEGDGEVYESDNENDDTAVYLIQESGSWKLFFIAGDFI